MVINIVMSRGTKKVGGQYIMVEDVRLTELYSTLRGVYKVQVGVLEAFWNDAIVFCGVYCTGY